MLRLNTQFKVAGVIFGCLFFGSASSWADSNVTSDWDLAVQMWTFRQFTLFEAIDKASSAGLEWIEVYPGQRIGGDYDQATTHFNMPAEVRQAVKDKLDEAGVRIRAYGVVQPDQQQQWRRLFEFCRDMGIQTVTSEPNPDQLDMVEQLCIEYDMELGIHNHPYPSRYWNPQTVLELIEDRDQRIGMCADIGHWMRSGVDPLESLAMAGDRVNSLHMKDLNAFDQPDAHDVVWGTGQANIAALLEQLYDQQFSGVITVEYERNWSDNLSEVAACVEYYNEVVVTLGSD